MPIGKSSRAAVLLNCLALCVASGEASSAAASAGQTTYPQRPVRVIVPLAPGGGSDIVARMLAAGLSERWAQAVIVDNRPGAGSTVGTAIAARAAADGHTLLVASSSIAISPALYRDLDYDVLRDFSAITLIAAQPSILAVHASVNARTVQELITLARNGSPRIAYGSAGVGSATHLGMELFQHATGIEFVHLPYKSAGHAVNALLSGEVQVLLTNMASLLPHVKSGRVRALGISSRSRSSLAPELPTLSETGVPGFEYSTWYGMLAPAKMRKNLLERIYLDTAAVLEKAAIRERFVAQGLEVHALSPTHFSAYLAQEVTKWREVARVVKVQIP